MGCDNPCGDCDGSGECGKKKKKKAAKSKFGVKKRGESALPSLPMRNCDYATKWCTCKSNNGAARDLCVEHGFLANEEKAKAAAPVGLPLDDARVLFHVCSEQQALLSEVLDAIADLEITIQRAVDDLPGFAECPVTDCGGGIDLTHVKEDVAPLREHAHDIARIFTEAGSSRWMRVVRDIAQLHPDIEDGEDLFEKRLELQKKMEDVRSRAEKPKKSKKSKK